MSANPYLVGITGGIGSGKSTVADQFALRGVTLVDSDLIAHQMTGPDGPAMAALVAEFGQQIRSADGSMNRAFMRSLAFEDRGARARLEAILHPMIRIESDRQVHAASSPYVMMVVPLLVETGGHQGRVDRVLVVDCPDHVQIARVMARSGLTEAQVLAIMQAQASRAQRLSAAHDVIDNGGSAEQIASQVARLHDRYLALAATKALAPT